MPTMTITLPSRHFQRAKERARREGFKSPAAWTQFLVERDLVFEESPKIKPSKIITRMKETGLYRNEFLRGLMIALMYADKTAQ